MNILVFFLALLGFAAQGWAAARIMSSNVVLSINENANLDNQYGDPDLFSADWANCDVSTANTIRAFEFKYHEDHQSAVFRIAGYATFNATLTEVALRFGVYNDLSQSIWFTLCEKGGNEDKCKIRAGDDFVVTGSAQVDPAFFDTIPSKMLEYPDLDALVSTNLVFDHTPSKEPTVCAVAQLSNGKSMQSRDAVFSVVGAFFGIITLGSAAVWLLLLPSADVYAVDPRMVTLGGLVEVVHSIYMSGFFSVVWPRGVTMFWSNFSWMAGIIPTRSVTRTVSKVTGAIFTRDDRLIGLARNTTLMQPQLTEMSHWSSMPWMGDIDIPGFRYGFPGLATDSGVPAPNGPLTGLLWFSAALAVSFVLALFMIPLKAYFFNNERLAAEKRSVRPPAPWWALFDIPARTMMMLLPLTVVYTVYQLALDGPNEAAAIAGTVFAVAFLFFIGANAGLCSAVVAEEEDPSVRWYSKDKTLTWTLGNFRAGQSKTVPLISNAIVFLRALFLGSLITVPEAQVGMVFVLDFASFGLSFIEVYRNVDMYYFNVTFRFIRMLVTAFVIGILQSSEYLNKAGFGMAIIVFQSLLLAFTLLASLYSIFSMFYPAVQPVSGNPLKEYAIKSNERKQGMRENDDPEKAQPRAQVESDPAAPVDHQDDETVQQPQTAGTSGNHTPPDAVRSPAQNQTQPVQPVPENAAA